MQNYINLNQAKFIYIEQKCTKIIKEEEISRKEKKNKSGKEKRIRKNNNLYEDDESFDILLR